MSLTWGDLLSSYGSYESPVFDIGYEQKFCVLEIESDYELNDGEIKFEYSISNDAIIWSEWIPFYESDSFIVESPDQEFSYFKFRINFRINPENGFSPKLRSVNITFKELHKVSNDGDLNCKPKLWITKKNGDGDIKLHNLVNHQTLELKNLKNGEQVFIDCEYEDIVTSLPLTYRYDDHNDVFIEFLVGDNYLYGQGDFRLDIKYQSRVLY